jgi:chemotaxis protein methyltransferase CheR
VTIWSAGCANGQEAFSLAMLLEEHGIDGSVIATDLSTAALQRTQAARYSARELAGLSAERIDRHLTRIGHEWEINRSLRDRVTIVQRNLLDAIPHQVHGCHVVFCRNVLIYFAPEHARAFLDRLADAAPDAAVFLGSAETIWPVSDRFDTVQAAGTFFYRPRAQRPPVANQTPSPEPPTTRPALDRKAVRRSDAQPPPSVSVESSDDGSTVEWLTLAGQRTAARGDHKSAVVAFRKCAYLAPDDPIAHLHLGLALDAAGDRAPAQRAYAAARQALLAGDPTLGDVATEGYTTVEFLRLLDTKMRVPSR